VEWKNETQISEFHLKIISNNAKAISSFNEIGNNRTLKGKKIKISAASTLSNTSNVHLVFVAKDKLDEYVKIFDMVEGKNILLVSDDYPKDNLVMINLIETSDHKLRFEINKSNIINQGITVLPELLLLGGTEIDVAKIYRKSQQSLRSIQKQVQHLQQSEKDLKNDNAERRSDIKKQKTLINTLNEEIELQTSSVKLQQIKIDSLSNASEELLDNIKNTRNTLTQQLSNLKTKKKELNKQGEEIKKGKIILKDLNIKIEKQIKSNKQQSEKLDVQKSKLTSQKNIIYFLSVITILVLVLIFTTYFGYKKKKKSNKILVEQKTMLTKTLKELKDTQSKLVKSEKMASLGVLTAGIAHEINNPINFISSGAHSLDNDFKDLLHILKKLKTVPQDGETVKERTENIRKLEEEFSLNELIQYIPQTIEDIKEGVNRTAEIIKGLLLYSRSDTSKLQKANIHESIDASLILLKDKFKDKIKIVKKYNLDIKDIECYPGQLIQVFTNLIDNAIDAINNKGTITITTALINKRVVISIQDTGEGISDANSTKIFDPFFTTKEVGRGTGLGLSICQGIINNHKGKIEINNVVGKGSEFVITLPTQE